MSTHRKTHRSFAAAMGIAMLGGCSNESKLSWTEDVKLPDGRVVTLQRYTEFKSGSSHLGDPSTESLQRFSFKHPKTGETIRWENTEEQGRLKTIALWLVGDTPTLLTRPAYGGDEWTFKCPNPPYLLYEYVQGQWKSKPLVQIGINRLRSNMTAHPLKKRQHIEDNKRHLTADQTADSYTYRDGKYRVPYVLDFTDMPPQTFAEQTCHYPSRVNYLLHDEGK